MLFIMLKLLIENWKKKFKRLQAHTVSEICRPLFRIFNVLHFQW